MPNTEETEDADIERLLEELPDELAEVIRESREGDLETPPSTNVPYPYNLEATDTEAQTASK